MTPARKTPRRRNATSPHRRPPALTWPDASWRWASDGALVLTLPVPGSANRQWRAGRGRTYKNKAAREYEEAAGWAMASCPKLSGEVAVDVAWYTPRKLDLDNRAKPLLDALKGIAFGDDIEVAELHMRRVVTKEVAACMLVSIRSA
jgi:Holliday junction resolvase RusA-like endonuclease